MPLINGIPQSVNPQTGIRGLDKVMAKVNNELMAIPERTMRGLIKSAALIRNETEHGQHLTPVDYGNLRASWFVVTGTKVHVGRGTAAFKDNKEKGLKASDFIAMYQHSISQAQQRIRTGENLGKSKFLIMGYGVNYALYVHENVGANFKRVNKKTGGKATFKWLQRAVEKHQHNIIAIVRENARIR